MNEICAIIDAQGFYLNEDFYIRECAIVSDKISFCTEFYTDINFLNLKPKEKSNIIYCKRVIHGLPLNPISANLPLPHSSDFENFIKCYYSLIATQEKNKFAVKHESLKQLLIKYGIPVVDLNDAQYGIPNMATIENQYGNRWSCSYHFKNSYPIRCAYRKCLHLYTYIKENVI